MAFAELLDQVGNLGRFQILQIVFLCTTIIIMYPHLFLENFTAAIPAHRCWVHLLDNDTISANDTGTLSQEDLLRVSIPLDSSLRPEKCRRFIHPQWQLLHQNGTFPNVTELDTEPCVDGWVYDRSTFSSTIVTEWELVCESQSLRLVVQSVLMTGALLGSPVYGYLSDRFGRKLGLRLSILQLAITGTSAAMAPNLLIYSSLRFLAGFCITVIVSNSCALMLEWVQPQSRALVTMLMLNVCSAGQILLGGLASAIQDWRTLMLIFSVPLFVNFLVSRKLVESAQWLIISNRIEEGVKELRRAARINGRLHAEENLTFEFVKSTMQKELDTPQVKISVFELFRAPKLRLRVCFTSLLRFATGLTFYGLALNVQYFGKSIFLAQILFGSVILASRCVFYPALNHIGRRTSQLLLFFTSGLCFLAIAFLFQEMPSTCAVLATVGISVISIINIIACLHHNELIPTILRLTSGGIQVLTSRTGAALAPLVMILGVYSLHLPWIIYGVICILAGLASQALPETKDCPLPNTIQDMENDTRESRKIRQEDMKITQF